MTTAKSKTMPVPGNKRRRFGDLLDEIEDLLLGSGFSVRRLDGGVLRVSFAGVDWYHSVIVWEGELELLKVQFGFFVQMSNPTCIENVEKLLLLLGDLLSHGHYSFVPPEKGKEPLCLVLYEQTLPVPAGMGLSTLQLQYLLQTGVEMVTTHQNLFSYAGSLGPVTEEILDILLGHQGNA